MTAGKRTIWRTPGLIDAHAHIGWVDFDAQARAKRSAVDTDRLIAEQRRELAACGFTAMRDAGGWTRDETRDGVTVLGCAAMIPGGDATAEVISGKPPEPAHGRWVKLFLTGGMGAPADRVLEPTMDRNRIRRAIAAIHAAGCKAMAHAWGGPVLDWAIDAGIDSVEHGVLLTGRQTERMAQAGIPLVPTVNIYRILAAPPIGLGVPPVVAERAKFAADLHPRAVRLAHDAGVAIGVGTDYCTPLLFGRNLEELDALESCGLTRAETWHAATEVNARIVGAEAVAERPSVCFDIDPLTAPHAADLRGHLVV